MGLVDEQQESFANIFFTSTLYKYPMLIIPYIPKYERLNKEQELAHAKVKRKILAQIFSFSMIFIFMLGLMVYVEVRRG